MMKWEYDPSNYSENAFKPVPPGRYRVRIEEAEETTSKTGKTMYKLKLKTSGQTSFVWFYLVFDASTEEAKKYTDQKLGSIWNSFNIPVNNLNLLDWKGKVGGAMIKNRTYNEVMQADVSYFLPRKEVDKLPAWQEGAAKTATQVPGNIDPNMVDPNAPVPF